jgi:Fe-S-cluster containining protein
MKNAITKESFQCDRHCGECCKKLAVKVTKENIKQIKKLGYKEEDFLENDLIPINVFILKRNKKGCIFLKKSKGGEYSCTIHKNRPKTCRQYPFFEKDKYIESCLPKDMFPNVVFKNH